jgi:hypothetical protein
MPVAGRSDEPDREQIANLHQKLHRGRIAIRDGASVGADAGDCHHSLGRARWPLGAVRGTANVGAIMRPAKQPLDRGGIAPPVWPGVSSCHRFSLTHWPVRYVPHGHDAARPLRGGRSHRERAGTYIIKVRRGLSWSLPLPRSNPGKTGSAGLFGPLYPCCHHFWQSRPRI